MSRPPLARVAGPIVSFCGLLVALVAAYSWEADEAGAFGVFGFLTALVGTVPVGVAYLSGGVVLGLAIASLGVWMLRTTAAASAVADSAAI